MILLKREIEVGEHPFFQNRTLRMFCLTFCMSSIMLSTFALKIEMRKFGIKY